MSETAQKCETILFKQNYNQLYCCILVDSVKGRFPPKKSCMTSTWPIFCSFLSIQNNENLHNSLKHWLK